MGQSSFKFAADKDWNWNDLQKELRELASISSFKTTVFKYFWNWIKNNISVLIKSIVSFLCIFILLCMLSLV